jgi:DNA helicase-2/ATP-dependent DNA helicase PcrA
VLQPRAAAEAPLSMNWDPSFAEHDVLNDPLIAPLNPEQREAVLHDRGPLLVLAGAGSGKTRVITHRIAWMVGRNGVAPWQVLAMTFTNKAAGEMRERVGHTVGEAARDLWLGTFHSIGVRLLRQLAPYAGLRPTFSIYDTDDQEKVIGRVLKSLGLSEAKPRQFAHYIDRAKNRGLLPADGGLEDEIDSTFGHHALKVYAAYEEQMRLADAVDFGDLILRPYRVLAQNDDVRHNLASRFEHVLVDEFQDTNHAQFALLKLLCSVHGNLTVVGDDDQSIYSWRGAEVGNILSFPKVFEGARVVKLERNYRSTGNILKASTAVVQANRSRHGKVLWTEQGDGDKLRLHVAGSDREEADWVAREIDRLKTATPLGQIAVFYRTNSLSRLLEESLRRLRLPYVLVGGQRFYERAEVKDALAWCRLLVNPSDSAGWLRAVVSPRRGIGQVSIDAVVAHAQQHGLSVPEASRHLLSTGAAGKATEKLREFERLVDGLRVDIEAMPAQVVGKLVLDRTGLQEALRREGGEEASDRLENLGELLSAMADHAESATDPSLRGFLEQVALVSDVDGLKGGDKVSLMTVHAAKGLEYDAAFVIGLEDGLLPHVNAINGDRSGGDLRDLEEERRLLYVAMTRARKRLHLSYARSRRRFGAQEQATEPSRFLQQVPRELVDMVGSGGAWRSSAAQGWGSGWSGGNRGNWSALVGRAGGHADDSDDVPVIHRGDDEAPEAPAASSGFAIGQRVRHVSFGPGRVTEVSANGQDTLLTIRFDQVGVKKIFAKWVKAV